MFSNYYTKIAFALGFILGSFFATFITVILKDNYNSKLLQLKNYVKKPLSAYEDWFLKAELKRARVSMDSLRYSDNKYLTEAQYLFNKIKILCIVLVRNTKNANAANSTWTKQCNEVKYVRLVPEKKEPKIPIKKAREKSSWTILCTVLQSTKSTFNWVLVVNDNTFVIMENVRYMVAPLDHFKGYYLGHAVVFWGTKYNKGSSGYALSAGGMKAFRNMFNSTKSCESGQTYMNQEDYYLGKSLGRSGIFPSDTRDSRGLSTFHGFNPQKLLFPGSTLLSSYYKTSVYPSKCCSPNAVTFEGGEYDKIFQYNYLINTLQVFNTGSLGNRPAPLPQEEVWYTFLKERGIYTKNISAEQYFKLWENITDQFPVLGQKSKPDD